MHVHFAGRIGISPDGVPYVDIRSLQQDAVPVSRIWGAWRSSSPSSWIDGIRASLAEMLEQFPNPKRYINQPPCVTGEKEI
jgi:hypothetical protein